MGKNFFILAGTLGGFAALSFLMQAIAHSYGRSLPGDAAMWQTLGLVLVICALVSAVVGIFAMLFEQVHRRHLEREERQRGERARRYGM
jgi:uncharacterized membrane protein